MITLALNGRLGHFFIRPNLILDDYCELIFESNEPYEIEDTGVMTPLGGAICIFSYRIKIHASLIHDGEDQEATFETTSRVVRDRIYNNVCSNQVSRFLLKRYQTHGHTYYLPTVRTWTRTNS